MLLRLAAVVAFCGAAFLSGCATVLTPGAPPLSLVVRPDSVAVRDGSGRLLGVTPLSDVRLRPADTLELSRPGWGTRRVPLRRWLRPAVGLNVLLPSLAMAAARVAGVDRETVLPLGLLIPTGVAVDVATGRAWAHSPRVLEVALTEIPPPPPPLPPRDLPLDPARASVAARLLLAGMAAAADESGCNRVVSETWLDEMDRVEPASVSTADSAVIAARAREHVDGARPRLRALCARSNPLLDSLAAVQSGLPPEASGGGTTGPGPEAGGDETETGGMDAGEACAAAALGHCITFPFGSAEIRPAFQDDLREIAAHLRAFELPVLVVVEGTADPSGGDRSNFRLALARAMAVRDALTAMGVRPDRIFVESCGEEERCLLVPGASGGAPGAELNRRVGFRLQITEGTP